MTKISGFSKLSKAEKIAWLANYFFTSNPVDVAREFASFAHSSVETQKLFDGISENTLTNFYLPYGVAPNFSINGKIYCVPMVIEESSVVAAAASAAKFWYERGGFQTRVLSTTKVGQVHFVWNGDKQLLDKFFNDIRPALDASVEHLVVNMETRGGGVKSIDLEDCSYIDEGYYQLKVKFETCNAMGANFINSVLEEYSRVLVDEAQAYEEFTGSEKELKVVMSILSNYTPECLVESYVESPLNDFGSFKGNMSSEEFAEKFYRAIKIARNDVYRATTHNKGIFNGIDAVVLATGNDFRAIEACGHTYAARDGQYRSLSDASIEGGVLRFSLKIPLAVGTVGGLTKLHPLAKRSLELLGNPGSKELMSIIASVGLAQNFAAVRSLVTTGIQQGHMKMHLNNILNHFGANEAEIERALAYFKDKTISFRAVSDFISDYRSGSLAAK